MKKVISKEEFITEFLRTRPDNFTIDGLSALFDYLEELEENCGDGNDFTLDVIALCCDFSEFASLEEFNTEYADEGKQFADIDELLEYTMVIMVDDDRFIIQDF